MERIKGGQPVSFHRKLLVCVHGFAGTGKTSFALTAPSPIYMLNLDRDARHLFAKLPEDVEIAYEWVMAPLVGITRGDAHAILKRAEGLVDAAVKEKAGSVVIDGLDVLWEICQTALCDDRISTALRYRPANEWMFSFLQKLYAIPPQVVVTATAREIWDGPTATGRYTHDGFKHLDRWLTHDLRAFIREDVEGGAKPTPRQGGLTYCIYVEQSKLNSDLVGRVYPNLTWALLEQLTWGK